MVSSISPASESTTRASCRPVHIHSRRYLGAKTRLLDALEQVIRAECGPPASFADLFGGTGVVAHRFNSPTTRVIASDTLRSNVVAMGCFLASTSVDMSRMASLIEELNALPAHEDNYVSEHFGGTYFTLENARRIGAIREAIARLERKGVLSEQETRVLLTSLLYATDKVANTCGHYDAFRAKLDTTAPLTLGLPVIDQEANRGNVVVEADANVLVDKIDVDVLYIDPPYNSRQYADTYHLLENLVRWDRPPVFGKARKMDRRGLKSAYCGHRAPVVFADLVARARCKHIVVSYNNMGNKGDDRSNARIPDTVILDTLRARGTVKTFEVPYQPFSAGKGAIDSHAERLFVCHVERA